MTMPNMTSPMFWGRILQSMYDKVSHVDGDWSTWVFSEIQELIADGWLTAAELKLLKNEMYKGPEEFERFAVSHFHYAEHEQDLIAKGAITVH